MTIINNKKQFISDNGKCNQESSLENKDLDEKVSASALCAFLFTAYFFYESFQPLL